MKFRDALPLWIEKLSSQEFIDMIISEDERMLKYVDILIEINKNGFLTLESQSGTPKRKFKISEKAYICGFMEEEKAEEFIKKMSIQTDKNVIYVPFCSDDIYIPGNLDFPLTIIGDEVNTHMSAALPVRMYRQYLREAKINKSEKVVYIYCWDPKWNRNAAGKKGLFTEVLKVLREIN